jgi:hypothetical protein
MLNTTSSSWNESTFQPGRHEPYGKGRRRLFPAPAAVGTGTRRGSWWLDPLAHVTVCLEAPRAVLFPFGKTTQSSRDGWRVRVQLGGVDALGCRIVVAQNPTGAVCDQYRTGWHQSKHTGLVVVIEIVPFVRLGRWVCKDTVVNVTKGLDSLLLVVRQYLRQKSGGVRRPRDCRTAEIPRCPPPSRRSRRRERHAPSEFASDRTTRMES